MVRCTVRFEDKQENDGKVQVPVDFTLNGSRIYQGDDVYIEHTPDRPLIVYPYIDFQGKTSTMAKVIMFVKGAVSLIFSITVKSQNWTHFYLWKPKTNGPVVLKWEFQYMETIISMYG